MQTTIYKVAEERYNSGIVFTGMTDDGCEITEGDDTFLEAFVKLIRNVDAQEEYFSFIIPCDVEAKVETSNTHPFQGDFQVAKFLKVLAPSLNVNTPDNSIADIIDRSDDVLTPEDIYIGVAFYDMLRLSLRAQAEEKFNDLFDLSNAFTDALNELNEARLRLLIKIMHSSNEELNKAFRSEPSHLFQANLLNSASYGSRLCVAMACGYFAAYGAGISLKMEHNKLLLSVNNKS